MNGLCWCNGSVTLYWEQKRVLCVQRKGSENRSRRGYIMQCNRAYATTCCLGMAQVRVAILACMPFPSYAPRSVHLKRASVKLCSPWKSCLVSTGVVLVLCCLSARPTLDVQLRSENASTTTQSQQLNHCSGHAVATAPRTKSVGRYSRATEEQTGESTQHMRRSKQGSIVWQHTALTRELLASKGKPGRHRGRGRARDGRGTEPAS